MIGDLIVDFLGPLLTGGMGPSGPPTSRDRRIAGLFALVLGLCAAWAWFAGATFLAWAFGGLAVFILLVVAAGLLLERWMGGSKP